MVVSMDFESWFTGLADGEGSFFISIWKNPKMKLGVALTPEFAITMHKKEEPMLNFIRDNLKIGTTKSYRNYAAFRVTALEDCIKLSKFFNKNQLISKKIDDFKLWAKCLENMKNKEHLTKNGIMKIVRIRSKMNKGKSKSVDSKQIKKWFK